MWSRSPKLVVLVELTVLWEERADEAYELKKRKYQDLAHTCRDRGWKTLVFPVEVGCRGFPPQSVWRMLGAVDIKGRARKTAAHALRKAAVQRESVKLAPATTHLVVTDQHSLPRYLDGVSR
ncbi:uncharacterized protein LOC128558219 [Mercenaria mercenaria]|uniref:uncharacterized protein LOC128558219 n=1 Tax=Mercenaria mercenaria TaxID=6596 RepID=UPI00234F62A1|nr:uncharacterized protein LOC128558219 [Mercenaria mercenaria]